MKPKFNQPIGERNHFWRLLLDNFWQGARKQLMARGRCKQQHGTCTQHNQTTLPQLTVRLLMARWWWCQKTCWRVVDEANDRPVGNPKRRFDEYSSKFFLSYETKVINPVEKAKRLKVMPASFATAPENL
jgi:hypothetical protein